MKNILSISFLSLYFVLNVGFTILQHTCGGESETMVATTSAEDPCGCSDEMPTDRCCTTEIQTIKIDDAQRTSATSFAHEENIIAVISHETTGFNQRHRSILRSELPSYFFPPPNNEIYIRNSVFLI